MAVFRFVVLAVLLGLCLAKKRYDGYKVLRVTPTDDFEVESIVDLKRHLEGKVDFWTEPRAPGASVDIMVAPGDVDPFQALLTKHGLKSTVTIEDVQKLIDQTTPGQGGIAALSTFRYDVYHNFDEIMDWMNVLATDHKTIVTREELGTSTGGRQLSYFKIGKPGKPDDPSKPIFWMIGGTHSREWLASATVIKIAGMLVDDYNKADDDDEIKRLLDAVDFYIMPISNPDGYVYTHDVDRLWRKTRSSNPSAWWCTGTDPNRNWDEHWDDPDSETWPCSSTYRGSSAFSEPETKLLSDHIKSLSNVQVFMDVHAYGNMWMVPYGWTKNLPPDYKKMKDLSDKAVAALKLVNGQVFKTGSISRVIYIATGSGVDWAYSKAKIPFSFALEIRDTGDGFTPPSSQIHPSSKEIYAAIKVVGNHIKPTS